MEMAKGEGPGVREDGRMDELAEAWDEDDGTQEDAGSVAAIS
jgi:hypothetical protein